jgi:hypothetical protein
MKTAFSKTPLVVPVDDEHARMMAYARSPEGKCRIAQAEAEISAGRGIEANAEYFAGLRARRKRAKAAAK